MQEAAKDTIRVTLMGTPSISKHAPLTDAQKGLAKDPDALELMALLFLTILSMPRAGSDPLSPKQTQYANWDHLFKTLNSVQSEEIAKPARNGNSYLLKKINNALSIRPDREKNTRERGDFGVNLGHLSIDAFQILAAAQTPHDETCQNIVVRLGAQRLLEGMDYPWLALPVFQALRQRLDDYYLDALCEKATGLLIKMEAATDHGNFDLANAYRVEARFLIEKGNERLRALGESHALAPRFAHLQARAAHLIMKSDAALSSMPRHNIPRRITSFVGRDAEMAKLETLLGSAHIVTIHGMGGCGKTRLALEAALDYIERSGEEAQLVELVGVADSALIPQAIAMALGMPEQKQRTVTEILIDRFREGRGLLILDNCEHLIKGCAVLVEKLAQSCPELTILATSRQLLNIEGEYPVPLEPLLVPPAGFYSPDVADPVAALLEYEAPRLFIDRMRPYNDFPVAAEHVAVISSICASLDGIPLALELAAARTRALSIAQINELLTDRFRLLQNGTATAPSRHKTLRAVIDWSYDLLTEQEQTLFCRLSVFAGGWTLEAAQAVGASDDLSAPDVLDLLMSLIDKSLVLVNKSASPGRFRMLETVREYALHRLKEQGEFDAVQRNHRAYFAALADEAQPHLRGSEPIPWLDRLEAEIDNLRGALAWRADEAAMRLACALYQFWFIRSYFQEGRQWLERDYAGRESLTTEVVAEAMLNAGNLAYHQGSLQDAKRLLEQSVELWIGTGNLEKRADALNSLGMALTLQGRYQDVDKHFQESLKLSLAAENEKGVADARLGIGRVAHLQDDHERAQENYDASLVLRRNGGDGLKLADLLMFMGLLATNQDRHAEAHAFLNESLALHTRFGSIHRIASLSFALADLARIQGNYAEALKHGEQSRVLMKKAGNHANVANITNMLAMLAYEHGDMREAEQGFEQTRAILLMLGNERLATGVMVNLASAVGKQGHYERAVVLFQECLTQCCAFEAWQWVGATLEEFGLLEAGNTPGLRPVILLSGANALLEQAAYHRTDSETQRFNQAMDVLREALGDLVFEAARDRACAMTKEQAVAYALGTRQA